MKKKKILPVLISLLLLSSCKHKTICVISSYNKDDYYTVWFKVDENTTTSIQVKKGETISTDQFPKTASKDDTIDPDNGLITRYVFTGWDKDLASSDSSNIQAVFDEYYECQFVNYDGSKLGESVLVKKGDNIKYSGETPTRESEIISEYKKAVYTFEGWSTDLNNITKPTLIKAEYHKEEVDYKCTVTIKDRQGNSISTFDVSENTFLTDSMLKKYITFNDESRKWVHYYDENDLWITSKSDRNVAVKGDITIVAKVYTLTYEQNGVWPQSKVTDEDLIEEIKDAESYAEGDYIEVGDNEYYKDTSAAKTVYRKVEPIEWIKLDGSYDTGAKMISNNVLTSYVYYNGTEKRSATTVTDYQGNTSSDATSLDIYPCSYQFSDIRTYLNTTFLNKVFGDSSLLVTTLVENDSNQVDMTNDTTVHFLSANTNDKVWLPSKNEVLDEEKCYTKFKGRSDLPSTNRVGKTADGLASVWWLRTPYTSSASATCNVYAVDIDGSNTYANSCNTKQGIRPMIQFDFSSLIRM